MKTILVTGASSFLGHHVLPLLKNRSNLNILTPKSHELNLLNHNLVIDYLRQHKPDTILHMGALCGGIGANRDNPALFLHNNLKMSINLFTAIKIVNGWQNNVYNEDLNVVTHFYGLGSVCAYPKHCPVPFKEDNLWDGMPEETNFPYGESKRVMLLMQQAFRKQFGLKGAHLIPVNMYGEHDHFDLWNSHVIPALINKLTEATIANRSTVEVWGDGTPTREFLYSGDCAQAIVKALDLELDYNDPINIGTGQDISIRDLANLIKEVTGFGGELRFTGEVSVNGQPKRRLDVSRAKEVLGFEAKTELRDGLIKTVAWYSAQVKDNK